MDNIEVGIGQEKSSVNVCRIKQGSKLGVGQNSLGSEPQGQIQH